jgi:hypothetical protein
MESQELSIADWKDVAGLLLQDDVDDGVSHVLRLFGTRHGADRAWVIRYDAAFSLLWNTHEWTAPGVPPMVTDLQGVPVEAGLWIHEGLEREGRVMIGDIGRMPRRARGLQAEFQRQGIRSLLALPVLRNDKLAFQIGYDSFRRERIWSEDQIRELADVAELIARALWNRGKDQAAFPSFALEARLIHLRVGVGSVAIPLSEILWIEADGDYTVVHTEGKRRITERRSIREWESLLPREEFIRIHRGTIVRVDAIGRLDRSGGHWAVMLSDGQALPVGRAYRPALRIHLGI